MYSKTDSELSISNKLEGSEKNNLNTKEKGPSCLSQRTRLEKLLCLAVSCLFLCVLGLIIGLLLKDGVGITSAVDNANNLQRSSFYYTHHPRWINLPLYNNQLNNQQLQKICVTKGCVEAAADVLSKVDLSVDPCEDFYQFACGKYIQTSVIPDDKGQVSEFSQMNDKLNEQVRLLLEDPLMNEQPPYNLAKNAYRACMDQETIERLGVSPLLDTLAKLGVWPGPLQTTSWTPTDEHTWYNIMYKLRSMGLSSDILINFSVSTDLRNSSKHVMQLDQPELGLAREFLDKGMEDPVVMGYKMFMQEVFMLLGVEPETAMNSVNGVIQFEISLANITMPRELRRDPNHQYNPMTIADLAKLDSDTPWMEYISTILGPEIATLTPEDVVVVSNPDYVVNLTKLLKNTPVRNQVNYIIWRIAAASLSYLNERAEDIAFKFSSQLSGQRQKPPRWQKCAGEVTQAMGPLVGSLYVQKHFSELSKSAAVEMVDEIRNKFQHTLDNVDWMDPTTRRKAKEKALAMVEYIGYPKELREMEKLKELYSGLELNANSYVGNGLNLSRYHMNYAFSKLRQAVDKLDWVRHGNPAMINAFYSPIENSIQFPAGILQGVFFNSERPRYLNYGAIGWVIGHEITHGFDDQGRQFDKKGNLVNWWDERTALNYLNKAQCMVEQYNQYSYPHLDNITVNGINTLGENIADNGGIKTSYQAYKSWVSRNGQEPILPGLNLTPEQLFWVSGANVWCSKHRPGDLRMNVMLGTHTPANYRIKGAFSNLEDFSRDFQCKVGSQMNPMTHQKCKVW